MLVAAASLGVTLLASATARAASIEVRDTGCAGVDDREIERLLGLELAFAASSSALHDPLRVDLACADDRVHIAAVDPVTGSPLERDITLGHPEAGREAGRERTIALLASQLFLASWAESFLEPPRNAAPPSPPAAAPAEPPAERPAEGQAPAHDWEIAGAVGVRLRDWKLPAVDERASLRPIFGIGRARVVLAIAYEVGTADRTGGTLAWSMASAGLGVGWRSARWGRLAFEGDVLGSVALVDARGQQPGVGVVTSSTRGVVGEVGVAVGPVLYAGPLRLGLQAQGGVSFPGAAARDASGRDVELAGAWAELALGVAIGGGGP
jgi:hypothetical protein